MKILIVVNDKVLASSIPLELEKAGNEVQCVTDGEAGLKSALEQLFDLIVLDWALPKKDGLSVLKELRERENITPIIILTAEGSVADIVVSLDSGANTCVTKPFDMRVLIAKMNVLIRRSKMVRGAEIRYAHITLDPVTHKVWSGGRKLDLTGKEYDLLAYFM